jgi:cbb3-type cytochrome oxidase subunit 1
MMADINTCSTWLRIAVLYFVVAALLGILMGMSGNHTLFPVHAHLNLLGWVSMAIFGLIYRQYPELAASKLAQIHFWLYNISLPVTMVTLACLLQGNAALEPVVGICSLLLGAAIVLFALNIMLNLPRN